MKRNQHLLYTVIVKMNYFVKVLFQNGLNVEMNNIRKNKEPEKILNVSYREYIRPFTKVNTENIYLDNAFIQQVNHFIPLFPSPLKHLSSSSMDGPLLSSLILRKHS